MRRNQISSRAWAAAIAAAAFIGLIGFQRALGHPARMGIAPKPAPTRGEEDLTAILDKLAAYAARLEGAVLDFVCREEIREKIDYALDQAKGPRPLVPWFSPAPSANSQMIISRPSSVMRTSVVYDYQCVRGKDGAIRETRTLLEEEGKKPRQPEAGLKTEVFVFSLPMLGPVGIFAERFRSHYDYRLAGRERIGGAPALIIEVTPRIDRPDATNLYGKAWIGEAGGEILKIEWSESRVGRREIFEQRGEQYKLKPRIRLRTEFSAEKNGIRFPSTLWIEEAYLTERGRAFIRSETMVTYKDFKFFTVEVDDIEIR